MNGTQDERTLARERLHPAIFIMPVLLAVVASLPSLFVLLMVRAFMDLLTGLAHQPISLFDNYFYIVVFSPAIFLSVPVLLVTLVAYRKSKLKPIVNNKDAQTQRESGLRDVPAHGARVETAA